jgi:hypothetical protein
VGVGVGVGVGVDYGVGGERGWWVLLEGFWTQLTFRQEHTLFVLCLVLTLQSPSHERPRSRAHDQSALIPAGLDGPAPYATTPTTQAQTFILESNIYFRLMYFNSVRPLSVRMSVKKKVCLHYYENGDN